MADWADTSPDNSTTYSTVLSKLRDRDKDAGQLFLNAPTNPITGMIRYNRSTDKFEEYDGAGWVAAPISIAGGGTGAATAADARTNLGLGTLAVQNSNAVSITGGSISGLTTLTASGTITAGLFSGSGASLSSIPNSATTATNLNTASAIVARDGSGNFSAGTITASLSGNATTATNGVVTTGSYADPSWITALSATKLTSGSLPDARLSSNVPLKNAANIFTAVQSCTSQPATQIAWGDAAGGTFLVSAGQTVSLFNGSVGYTATQDQDPSGIIDLPTTSENVRVQATGVYFVSAHVTVVSSTAATTFRMRIFAGASVDTETLIAARAEQFVDDANKYVVLSASGIIIAPSTPYRIGVKVFMDNAGQIESFAGQVNNTISIVKLW